jgi:hypothetical protein
MVKRTFVGAADIHSGAASDRFEALENLDRVGVIVTAG